MQRWEAMEKQVAMEKLETEELVAKDLATNDLQQTLLNRALLAREFALENWRWVKFKPPVHTTHSTRKHRKTNAT